MGPAKVHTNKSCEAREGQLDIELGGIWGGGQKIKEVCLYLLPWLRYSNTNKVHVASDM